MTPMLSVEEARRRILAPLKALSSVSVPLSQALGRTTASLIDARRRQPPEDVSAMDGFAARSTDLATLPATLWVVGNIPAGIAPPFHLESGQAARIFTGALVPKGADVVVLQENVTRSGDTVAVQTADVRVGAHIRRGGSDFENGERMFAPGHMLTARDIALLAAMDVNEVDVVRRPKIAVLATGDELTRPGVSRGPAQIVAASLDGILAQIEAWGGHGVDLGIAPDDPKRIAEAVIGQDSDFLVTLGGASVGDHDLVRDALADQGLTIDFWRIAMRPGKPLMSGVFRGSPFLGLPGNPVSTLVCSLLFLKPAIYAMLGRSSAPVEFLYAKLGADLPANDQREDYMRAVLAGGIITPFAAQDSGQLRPLAHANALLVRPANDPARHTGDMATFLPLDNC